MEVDFNPDMAYLTTTYALYFAYMTTNFETESQIAIIEIDTDKLDKRKVYPYENFICDIVRRQNADFQPEEKNKKLHKYIRNNLEKYRGNWTESLKILGTVGYKGIIPPNAITRYAVFDLAKNSGVLALSMMDPIICATNYALFGKFYRQFIAWLFDKTKELPHVKDGLETIYKITKHDNKIPADKKIELTKHFREQVDLFRKLQKKRDGIRVVSMVML